PHVDLLSAYYNVASPDPENPAYGFIVRQPSGVGQYVGGNIRMRSSSGVVKIQLTVPLDKGSEPQSALMHWPTRINNMVLEGLEFEAENNAEYAFHAASEYHPSLS